MDIPLTSEELEKLFSAVRKRDMDALLKQKADLEKSVAQLEMQSRWWNNQARQIGETDS